MCKFLADLFDKIFAEYIVETMYVLESDDFYTCSIN